MKKYDVMMMSKVGIIAALYVALTLAFSPLSYGGIQFRIAEVLVLLVLYKKEYSISLILGCFVSNLFSPLGWADIVFGTLATALSVIPMMFVKNKYIAALFPVIFNGLIVGAELYYVLELPFWLSTFEVAVGEFVVIYIVGIALFNGIEQNKEFMNILGCKNSDQFENKKSILKPFESIVIAFTIISIIFYFAMPIYTIITDDITNNIALFNMTKNNLIILLTLIIPIILLLTILLIKNKFKYIFNLILIIIWISLLIFIGFNEKIQYTYFFQYLLIGSYIILNIYKYKKESTLLSTN